MSWCGGGEIRPTPGVECRTLAMVLSTLCPGSWPPSPGFAPCAILICIMSELTRYSAVTPKRPDATCLIADLMESPFGNGLKRSDSSPRVRHRFGPLCVFGALAGVGFAADTVHGDGKRRVCLARDRSERHGAGREAPHNVLCRLDVFDGHRLAAVFLGLFHPEHAADGQQPFVLLVHDLGESAIVILRVAAHRVLEARHGLGGAHVILAAHTHGIVAADVEHRTIDRGSAEGIAVTAHSFLGDFGKTDALDAGVRTGEVLVDEVLPHADGIKDLRAAIGLVG